MKKIRIFTVVLFAVLFMGVAGTAEEITLTTYYPAPYGAYDELTTTGATYLATDSGNVGIGTTSTNRKLHLTGDTWTTIRLDGTNGGQVILGTGSTEKWSMYVLNNILRFYWFGTGPGDKVTIESTGNIDATSYSVGGTAGWSGTFGATGGKTVTVVNGIITDVS